LSLLISFSYFYRARRREPADDGLHQGLQDQAIGSSGASAGSFHFHCFSLLREKGKADLKMKVNRQHKKKKDEALVGPN